MGGFGQAAPVVEFRWVCFAALLSGLVTGCSERHPPSGSPAANPPGAAPSWQGAPPRASAEPAIQRAAASAAVVDTGVAASASAAAPGSLPAASPVVAKARELLDAAGKPLPQTEARPDSASSASTEMGRQLFQAILSGDPEQARQVFFPVVAYEQVKAIEKPAKDWNFRLWKAFERTIGEYHRQVIANLADPKDRAEFVALEIPDSRVAWMKPGSEGNRLGYWRVLRSQLRYRIAGSRERTLEITSLISWRGEWYVVHLKGFK